MSKDIDSIAAAVAETTTSAAIATARIYLGVATGTQNVSSDGWIQGATLLSNYFPTPHITTVAGTSYTVGDVDVNGIVKCTGSTTCTITFPSNLTRPGTIVVRKAGTGNVVIAATASTTINADGNKLTIVTQNHAVSVMWDGAFNTFWMEGGEA